MKKIAGLIVKVRYALLALFLVAAAGSAYMMQFVNVNYDMTEYLPDDSPTSVALGVMEKEFGNTGFVQLMLRSTTAAEADAVADIVKAVPGVDAVLFDAADATNLHGDKALIKIYLEHSDFSEEATAVIEDIEAEISGYDYAISGYAVESGYNRDMITKDMAVIMLWSFGVVLIILMLTSHSWADPLVFACGIGVALLLNLGTNALFPSISFVSQAICAVLQLALAMDYSIIILHRYDEEREKTDDKLEAMRKALTGCVTSVAASSLTTIAGLCALMFMRYTIGLDIGSVLAKGIVCSLLTAFFFLPCVILLFDGLLRKTQHRPFVPKMDGVARYALKAKYVVPALSLVLFVGCFFIQEKLGLIYELEINENSDVYAERAEITDEFGYQNPLILLVPKGDPDKEREVLDYVKSLQYNDSPIVNSGSGLVTTELYDVYDLKGAAERFDSTEADLKPVFDALGEKGLVKNGKVMVWDLLRYLVDTDYISVRAADKQKEADDLWGQVDSLYSGLTAAEMAEKYDLGTDVAEALWRDMGAAPADSLVLDDVLTHAHDSRFFIGYAEKQERDLWQDYGDIQKLEALYTPATAAAQFQMTPQQAYGVFYNLRGNNLPADLTMKNHELIETLYAQSESAALAPYHAAVQQAFSPVTAADIKADKLLGAIMNDKLTAALFTANGADPATGTVTNYQLLAFVSENKIISTYAPPYAAYQQQYDAKYKEAQALFAELRPEDAMTTYGLDGQQAYVVYAMANPDADTTQISGKLLLKYLYEEQHILALDKAYWGMVDAYTRLDRAAITARSPMYGEDDATAALKYYGKNPDTGKISAYQLMRYTLSNGLIPAYGKEGQAELNEKRNDALEADEMLTREQITAQYGIDGEWLDAIFATYASPEKLSKADLVKFVSQKKTALAIGEEKTADIMDNWADAQYGEDNYSSENYSRLLFNVDAEVVGDETFYAVDTLRQTLGNYYDDFYLLGSGVNIYDIRDTFGNDVTLVNIVTLVAVFIIVMFSFMSLSIPLVLVACIQGAIFVNFSINTVTDSPVYFVCFLIALCIQMGATIDYGILLTDRFCHYREKYAVPDAIRLALNGSISTILTSGLILIIAAAIVGFRATVPIISYIGKLISQGAVVSVVVVLFVLPCCLCLFDRFLEKGSYKRRFNRDPVPAQEEETQITP